MPSSNLSTCLNLSKTCLLDRYKPVVSLSLSLERRQVIQTDRFARSRPKCLPTGGAGPGAVGVVISASFSANASCR